MSGTPAILSRFACFAVLISAGISYAAEPIANIRSSTTFKVQGVSVPSTVTTAWPLVSGDEIVTGSSSASILLNDGSRVNVEKDSRVKLETAAGETTLRILSGSLFYKKADQSRLSVFSMDSRVKLASQGVVAAKPTGTALAPQTGTFRADIFGPPPTSNFR